VSNRRKLRGGSGQPLPECTDCDSSTIVGVAEDGPVIINLQHDPECPSWQASRPAPPRHSRSPKPRPGRTVVYAKVTPS
jgi:hypothetical protein